MTSGTERREAAFVKETLADTRFQHVRWIAETGSTNDDLLAIARDGAPEQVLITDLQTAGRGRRDRVWDAPARTSILMSILTRGIDPGQGFWAVGAVALAASKAIDELTTSPCRLKWPNDVMLGNDSNEKKVAGVLAQVADDVVVIGIGINTNWPEEVPAELAERGTAVNRHSGSDIDRAELAANVLRRAAAYLDMDRTALRIAWKSQCSTLGRQVRLEHDSMPESNGTEVILAVAADVSDDGALIVERGGVQTTHHVGDVVHVRPVS